MPYLKPIVDETPDDPRRLIGNVEFYITNVCNLTCTNCNRFNNHDFRGWQAWYDYQADYETWAQHVKLQRITIMGGEPLLNPSLCDWVDGINRLWGRRVQILTNGTRLNHVPGLYDRLVQFGEQDRPQTSKNWLGVSLHNLDDRERCFQEIGRFLKGHVRYHHRDDADNTDNCHTWGARHAFVDENGMRVHVWEYDSFYNAAVRPVPGGGFRLWDHDPEMAHSRCGFVMFKCYHFIRGLLYKCGPVALMPEFDQQHRLMISDQDRQLLNAYQPLSPYDFETKGHDFLDHIDDVIDQCKFCPVPVSGDNVPLRAVTKRTGSVSSFD